MSAEDLALFLRHKMGEQRTNNIDIVRRSNISRRTWYRLLNADIEEAKLSTLIKLANTLDTGVTQLLEVYFEGSPLSKHVNKPRSEIINPNLDITTNLPCNSLVSKNQKFTKTWIVKNRSQEHWKGFTLNCIDDISDTENKENGTLIQRLKSEQAYYVVPDTNAGDAAIVSVNFIAPGEVCTTQSNWAFFKNGLPLKGNAFRTLRCIVKVAAIE